MNSNKIRQAFFSFFQSKEHQIFPSAPMVIKNDPTLMFTNAGMNQFKDLFLGNLPTQYKRIANTQKCLRVSGKHNDLEEVGHDTYHHTMFEMLGNWSFGDYFKKEAISWAMEFLTVKMNISKDRIYATIFEGNKEDNLPFDKEAYEYWKEHIGEEKIISGSKKDNFWEMGDTGPCGPCSEIHIDLRNDINRKKIDGKKLINKDHPLVIEIWNLVFIQYNRKANGKLEQLLEKHIDTGLGFERLCMVIQNKQSNYDTDIFQLIIQEISKISNQKYGINEEVDVAMRVITDHLRAISFSIADGQLPSNVKAGYVIRRILRRAVRYGYTFLNLSEPFINRLVPVLVRSMGDTFPEIKAQQELIIKVITEEEISFLRTLEVGIRRFENYISAKRSKVSTKIDTSIAKPKEYPLKIDGKFAFELYDTYGFPIDLTVLLAKEKDMPLTVDIEEFNKCLEEQKNRSRQAANIDTGDWVEIYKGENEGFIGYDFLETNIRITRYRKIKVKEKELYQFVFDKTPFYAEAGGQVGDTGYVQSGEEKVSIIDTKRENNLIVHFSNKLPSDPTAEFKAYVDKAKRELTANNHTATHLLHHALRKVLGKHIEQKGSLVDADHLRFDFSHFQKVSDEELARIESMVNENIRKNLPIQEKRAIPMQEAKDSGAIAFFGEKYVDFVRTIQFGDSIELCGGTHVPATGQIGFFKIISETPIAAGIRRIEAITSVKAEKYINDQLKLLKDINQIIKSSKNLKNSIEDLINENSSLHKQIEKFTREKIKILKDDLISKVQDEKGINIIAEKIEIDSFVSFKDLAFQLKNQIENLFLVLGAEINLKANLIVMISENLVKEKNLNAIIIIREMAKDIRGNGGGQSFFATAGGKNPAGITNAILKAKKYVENIL